MSADDGDGGPGRREVAYRLFAAEFDDADFSYSESDEERAPNYVITPTGLRVNRLFAAGVLTEVEHVNDDVLRGRVVDPTGAFVTYAGQYQPDEMAFLERTDPPAFVALTGKARTFEPEDSDRVFTSVRPESVNVVDADTRDRWTVSAAEATLERVAVFADALELDVRGDELREALSASGVSESLAAGIPLALDHYGTTPAYLDAVRRLALDALGLVAGERDDVRSLDAAPDEEGPAEVGPIPDVGAPTVEATAGATAGAGTGASATAEASTDSAGAAEATGTTETAEATETATAESAAESTGDADAAEESAAESGDTEGAAAESGGVAAESGAGQTVERESAESGASSSTDSATASPSESAAASTADSGAESDDLGSFEDTSDSNGLGDFEDPGSDGLGDVDDDAGSDSPGEPGGDSPGDDEDSGSDEPSEAESEDADVDEAGMYELDEEERREIEEEYGTEFSSGAEVGEPGEAGIDVPDADDLQESTGGDVDETTAESTDAHEAADAETDAGASTEEATDAEAATDAADEAVDEEPADVDIESVAVDTMKELDEGDGAERERVVAAVVEEYGVEPDEVEDAIQSALMSGRCYEPTEDRLKAI